MNHREEMLKLATRRQFFKDCGTGIGTIALASLFNDRLFSAEPSPKFLPAPADSLGPKAAHFAAQAKAVIYLHMAGAPSQLDLLDFKPKLKELNGQDRKSTRLNSSHIQKSRMPSSA